MRIKLLRNLGREYPPYRLDEEVDADDKLARELVARGLAEVIKGVPRAPEIRGIPPASAEKATDDLEGYRKRAKRETKNDTAGRATKKE